ncbi:hypothetical protein ACFS07_21685 [Undibacterium arcticum]
MLPHEIWLSRQFGLEHDGQSSPPIAPAAMQAFNQAPAAGIWFIINPVHIHFARDHLVLTDQRQLLLSEQQSLALFDSAKPYFEEVDKTLVYGNAHTWFVRADEWNGLQTSTPDATCGHNIDIWMPKGAHALAWRKLQNEVQMLWHSHPVNEERDAHGLKPVNSLWLWGGAPADLTVGAVGRANFTATFNLSDDFSPYGQLSPANRTNCSVADLIAAAPKHGLLLLDSLIGPALASDWATWLDRMHDYETIWFAPLLATLKARRVDRLTLHLSHGGAIAGFFRYPPVLR